MERGQELNTGLAQIRTLVDRQREQILAECQAEIKKHEFQADYDRRRKQKLSETIETQQEELHRARSCLEPALALGGDKNNPDAAWLVLSGASAGGFVCFLCLLRGFSTLVIAGAPWRLLTFVGPSSVCERDVQKEPQQVSQPSDEGRLSHVTG